MKKLVSYNNFVNESKLQNEYRDFFSKMLEIYGVKSPAEFKDDKSKAEKFYDDIKKGWNNGEGISQYGKELISKFEETEEIKESKSEECDDEECDDEIDNEECDDKECDDKKDKKDDKSKKKEKMVKESTYTTPSELWEDCISKFLDICNNYPEVEIDITDSNVIKIDCDNRELIDDLIAEFEQINPEYVCDYDPIECQIIIEEK